MPGCNGACARACGSLTFLRTMSRNLTRSAKVDASLERAMTSA